MLFYLCVLPDELDEVLVDNRTVILQSISEDLRGSLPLDAMLPCETTAIQTVKGSTYSMF